jgi:hypothetical protein
VFVDCCAVLQQQQRSSIASRPSLDGWSSAQICPEGLPEERRR